MLEESGFDGGGIGLDGGTAPPGCLMVGKRRREMCERAGNMRSMASTKMPNAPAELLQRLSKCTSSVSLAWNCSRCSHLVAPSSSSSGPYMQSPISDLHPFLTCGTDDITANTTGISRHNKPLHNKPCAQRMVLGTHDTVGSGQVALHYNSA